MGKRPNPKRAEAIELLVAGAATTDEVLEWTGVTRTTLRHWLNHEKAGLAAIIFKRDKDKALVKKYAPVVEWMKENKVRYASRAAAHFGLMHSSLHRFIQLHEQIRKDIEAACEEVVEHYTAPPLPPEPSIESQERSIEEMEAELASRQANLGGLLDKLRESIATG